MREPVLSAHNDYTDWSGPQRVREIMGDEAEELLERRFAIIQVWRAINQPIQSNPLAIADARSVSPDDLMVAERRYPHRVGQTYRLKYNPGHRWFYFPQMRRDEALVFKVYDSAKDGRARFTPHTSFDDPTTPPGAPAAPEHRSQGVRVFLVSRRRHGIDAARMPRVTLRDASLRQATFRAKRRASRSLRLRTPST